MSAHKIGNPVPTTPEQMGQILGLGPERVAALRKIRAAPAEETSSGRSVSLRRASARKTGSSQLRHHCGR